MPIERCIKLDENGAPQQQAISIDIVSLCQDICEAALLYYRKNKEHFSEIIKTVKGNELCGIEYEQLFDFAKVKKRAWYVVADGYVTLDSGSGIVHIAPAFGEDDARVGRDNDLPF